MNHDILGEINRSAGDSGAGVASIEYESRKIEIGIDPDDQPFETTLKLGTDIVLQLGEHDKAAKRIIVSDLRETYNGGWNEYDEVQDDGCRAVECHRADCERIAAARSADRAFAYIERDGR